MEQERRKEQLFFQNPHKCRIQRIMKEIIKSLCRAKNHIDNLIKRLPNTAAVAITKEDKCELSYAKVVKRARDTRREIFLDRYKEYKSKESCKWWANF